MYLLIGIWGSEPQGAAAGPFKAVWKRLDVGGKEYAAMKLTLMLLVGSAAILVGDVRCYFAAGARTFDMQVLAKTNFPRDMQLWCSRCCGWASARWPASSPSTPGRRTATPPRRRRCRCCTPAC
jgi:NADH:ubiquinone oxidoreductase subunit 4 (subunit M)